jgi:hypothetical protein
MKVAKAKERFWLRTALDHQLSYDVKKCKDWLCLFVALSESVKDLYKGQTLKEPTLAQLDRVLYSGLQQCVTEESPWLGILQ